MSSREMEGKNESLAVIVKREIQNFEQVQIELLPNNLTKVMDKLMIYLELLPAEKEVEAYQAIIDLKKIAWESGFYSGFEKAVINGYSISRDMQEVNE